MFWVDVLLSISLPFLFFGLFGAVMALWVKRAALKPETIERVRRKNPISPYERHQAANIVHGRSNRGWESSFDSEVQRLRRKSLGLD